MKLVLATHNLGKIKEMKEILGDFGVDVLSAEEAGVKEDVLEDGKTFKENALKKAKFISERLNPPYSPFAKGGELNPPRPAEGGAQSPLKKGGSKGGFFKKGENPSPNLPLYKRGRSGGGFWAVADDSGICIKALDDAPGVYSARWMCLHSGCDLDKEKIFSDNDLASFTLEKMRGVPSGKREAYFQCVIALVLPNGENHIFEGKVKGQIAGELRGKSRPKLPYDLVFIPDGYKKTFAEMADAEKNKISHRGLALKKLREFFESNKIFLEKH